MSGALKCYKGCNPDQKSVRPRRWTDLIRKHPEDHIVLDRVIHFGETLGDQVKGRSPKKLETLIEVPNVVHVKVHVLSFNMILISSP